MELGELRTTMLPLCHQVEGKKDTLIKAVASMFQVSPSQISMNVIGQSSLLNHQVTGLL